MLAWDDIQPKSLHSNSKSDSQSMSGCEINFTPQRNTASIVCMCVYVHGSSKNKAVFVVTPIVSWYSMCVLISGTFDLFVLCTFLPLCLVILTYWNMYVHTLSNVTSIFLSFIPSTELLFFFWNTLNADFRLKCAPLFSLLPSFFLFLALLCYLLPIGLTLVHCSLAFCQTWFLTPASSLFFPLSPVLSWQFLPFPTRLFPFPINPAVFACEFRKRFIGDPIFLFLQSCYPLSFSPFYLSCENAFCQKLK